MKQMEECLRLIADLESFTGAKLSVFPTGEELSPEALDLVNAAASQPDYKAFQALLRQRKGK